ncbi:TonB-dependent receptor [Lysobacter firmicutimachus]|uniref:TonB-dependent receptor n=1 Tax=Lysobacter firmicutimachus TaxID=1792846 RepID=A0ABU8D751_9GAMM
MSETPKRAPLTSACLLVIALMSQRANAQAPSAGSIAPPAPEPAPTQEVTDLDRIQVVGIRGSLERSSDRKRDEKSITDTISAEDVGKFPDANIADALQRVTGVQIGRTTGGEGRFVSIRGLNSQFNLTTFNGRVLATDNAGRDFSFDVMPAEVLNRVTVYKSPTASQPDGSIGGLVELSTFDPLSRPGRHFSGSVSALHDDASSSTTPRLGFIGSDTFRDNTVGVFGGLYYYKRKWRSDTFESFARSTETTDANGDGVRSDPADGRGAFPGIISYQVKTGDRERLSWVGGLTWRPNDRLKTTLDAFYSRYETPETNYSYNVNFYSNDGWGRFANATLAPWNGGGVNRHLITSFDLDDTPLEIGTDSKERSVDLYQVGWNTRFQATDKLAATFDLAYSVADRPNSGKDYFTVAGVNGGRYRYQAASPVPSVSCVLPDGRSCLDVSNDEIGLHFMEQKGESTRDEAISARADFDYVTYLGDVMATLEGGLFYANREKDKKFFASPSGCGYCGFGDTLGEAGVRATTAFPDGGYRAGLVGGRNRWPALDAAALFQAAVKLRGQEYFDSTIAAKLRERASSLIEEDQYGGYVQANFSGDRWDGNVGLRYVRTDMTSKGHSQELLALEPIPNSTNYRPTFSDVHPVSVDHNYDDWLPSANFTYRFNDNLQLRAAASRAITRPTFTQLGVDVNYEINSYPPRVTRNGNPELEAIRSDAFDLSLEWYGDEGAAASVALFHKRIDGFVTMGLFPETILGQTFQVTAPLNGDTAQLTGLEAAYQYMHSSGFGGQINYTYVDSTADVTVNGVRKTTTLDGVSRNTLNLQAIYEKGPIAARLSYSYRDKYVSCAVCGPVNTPATTAASGFLDLSASYAFNDKVTGFLQVYNLTEEVQHTYALDERFTTFYEPFARRFELGVRVSF